MSWLQDKFLQVAPPPRFTSARNVHTPPHHVKDRALPTQMAGTGVLGWLQTFLMALVVAVQGKGLSNKQFRNLAKAANHLQLAPLVQFPLLWLLC